MKNDLHRLKVAMVSLLGAAVVIGALVGAAVSAVAQDAPPDINIPGVSPQVVGAQCAPIEQYAFLCGVTFWPESTCPTLFTPDGQLLRAPQEQYGSWWYFLSLGSPPCVEATQPLPVGG